MTDYDADNKWNIGEDGFYRITVDVFRETIRGEYLGKELPEGIAPSLEDAARVNVTGKQVRMQHCEPSVVQLISVAGQLCATALGTDVSLTAPGPGVYLVRVDGAGTHFTRKVVVE